MPLPQLECRGRTITDPQGNPVYLRGVCNDGPLRESDLGWYLNEQNVAQMEAWGINVIRIHTNVVFFHDNTNNYIQNMHNFLDRCEAHGIYVVYDIAGIGVDDWPCPSPLPQFHSGNPSWWQTDEDYYNFWVALVTEFERHSNVIWDSHNEPTDESGMSLQRWVDTCNEVVRRIRQVTQKPFIFEWHYNGDLGYVREGYVINGTNIIYSAHIYRYWGHLPRQHLNSGLFGRQQTDSITDVNSIMQFFTERDTGPPYSSGHRLDWDYVLNTVGRPIWVGECGTPGCRGGTDNWDCQDDYPYPCPVDSFDPVNEQNLNDQHESEGWRSILTVLNDLGIGYAMFQWWDDTRSWGTNVSFGVPNEYTQIMMDAIRAGGGLPPPLFIDANGPYSAPENNPTVTLQGSASGGAIPYTWDWDFGDGTPHASTQNPTHTYPSVEGTYNVTLAVTDNDNTTLQAFSTVTITAVLPLGVTVSPSTATIAIGEELNLTAVAEGGAGGYQYQWYDEGGSPIQDATNPILTLVGAAIGESRYYCIVTDSANDSEPSNWATVTVVATPTTFNAGAIILIAIIVTIVLGG